MNVSEFERQPRDGYEFDFYLHPEPISSPLGDFTVELQMDIDETAPPTDDMVGIAMNLVDQFNKGKGQIAEMVYEQYRQACGDGEWMKLCEVETGLSRSEFVRYLNGRTLTVSHDSHNSNEPYSARVYMSPQWDEEHGLYFMYDGECWTLADC